MHKDPEKLVGHNEQARLEAYNEGLEEPVPAVPADISETPKFIKYGAAVLLGLAFGIGTYVWYNKGVPSAADNTQTLYSAGTTDYNYFGRPTFYDIFYSDTDIPAPLRDNGIHAGQRRRGRADCRYFRRGIGQWQHCCNSGCSVSFPI